MRPATFAQAVKGLTAARAGLRLWLLSLGDELPEVAHFGPVQVSLRALAETLQAANAAFDVSTAHGLAGEPVLLAFGLVDMAERALCYYADGESAPAIDDLRLTVAHALDHLAAAADQAHGLQIEQARAEAAEAAAPGKSTKVADGVAAEVAA